MICCCIPSTPVLTRQCVEYCICFLLLTCCSCCNLCAGLSWKFVQLSTVRKIIHKWKHSRLLHILGSQSWRKQDFWNKSWEQSGDVCPQHRAARLEKLNTAPHICCQHGGGGVKIWSRFTATETRFTQSPDLNRTEVLRWDVKVVLQAAESRRVFRISHTASALWLRFS